MTNTSDWITFAKNPGFIIHSIIGSSNAHTHGITDSYDGHPELEIQLNIDPQIQAQLLNQAGFLILGIHILVNCHNS